MASNPSDLFEAARLLREGGTVAFPTETVYGLGADALDPRAVERIFVAKQRPSWDPLIVHIASQAMLEQVAILAVEAGRRAERLAAAFWPGPLTMLLPRTPAVPDRVTAGRQRVGVRLPAHPVTRALLDAAGVPLAAPSANRFGHISPTTAEHVFEDLDGRIDAVLDGGPASVGIESTVLDVCEWPMRLYRPGAITVEQIRAVAGEVVVASQRTTADRIAPESLPSPGVGLRHYAPRARLVLVRDAGELLAQCVAQLSTETVGVMVPNGWEVCEGATVYEWGPWDRHDTLAQRIFAGLRALDIAGATIILCPVPEGEGIANALRDRLGKAALPL